MKLNGSESESKMAEESMGFDLTNSLAELDELNRRIEQFGHTIGMPPNWIAKVNIALEELFTNIVTYAYKDQSVHRIGITLDFKPPQIVIRIEDDGIPFNPAKAEAPDTRCPLDKRSIGGLGIHLCKKLMDDLTYERLNNKNVVTLRKQINDD